MTLFLQTAKASVQAINPSTAANQIVFIWKENINYQIIINGGKHQTIFNLHVSSRLLIFLAQCNCFSLRNAELWISVFLWCLDTERIPRKWGDLFVIDIFGIVFLVWTFYTLEQNYEKKEICSQTTSSKVNVNQDFIVRLNVITDPVAHQSQYFLLWNKKVLLRERKRHTAYAAQSYWPCLLGEGSEGYPCPCGGGAGAGR